MEKEIEKNIDLKQMIEEDKKRRIVAFKAYLENGMKEYNCGVIPVVKITPRGVESSVEIEAY